MEQKLKNYLDELNIRYTEYNHPPAFTVEESKDIKKNIPAVCSKNLFLRDEKKNFYLVCMPCEKRLNLKFLQKRLSVKKLQFGTPEELKEHLNITPGSVSIFCMIHSKNVFLIIDKSLWDSEHSGFHPNINTSTLVLTKADLKKFYNSLNTKKEVIDLE